MDISFDSKAPSIVIEVKEYKNGYNDIRRRDGKIRAITEITKDNANHCKELMKIVDDLRHLDGMKKSEIQMQYFKNNKKKNNKTKNLIPKLFYL